MIAFVFAWFRSLFTRRSTGAAQPAVEPAVQPTPVPNDTQLRAHVRRLTRKNRNQHLVIADLLRQNAAQATRIEHLAAWHAAHRERTDQLLSEIHDLTARVGELEADIAAAQNTQPTPAPKLDDPDTWTPEMLNEYNQAEAQQIQRQIEAQRSTIHSLAEHIRLARRAYHDHHMDGESFEDVLNEAVGAADLADWDHADDYDGTPFPPIPPDPTDPVRDHDLSDPEPARIETWDPSFPGQWRPLPAPAPRGYHPGGIL